MSPNPASTPRWGEHLLAAGIRWGSIGLIALVGLPGGSGVAQAAQKAPTPSRPAAMAVA